MIVLDEATAAVSVLHWSTLLAQRTRANQQPIGFDVYFIFSSARVMLCVGVAVGTQMDEETQRSMREAVHHALDDRTVIIIAHRLATLDRCNQIVVMGSGRVLEMGPPAVLARDPTSAYAALLRAENMQ